MTDAGTQRDGILVFDEALDAVGRRMMDATVAGLRLGMYDVVDDPRALDNVRMSHPIMLDPPEGSTDGQGRPLSSHDMASYVMLGKEISDAVRSEGLDPIVVATQALEGRLAEAGDARRIEAHATAIATTIVPEGTKGDTYVCMRTPWTPVLICGAHTTPPYVDATMLEMKGPKCIDVHLDDRTTLLVSPHLVTVHGRMDCMEALRLLAEDAGGS